MPAKQYIFTGNMGRGATWKGAGLGLALGAALTAGLYLTSMRVPVLDLAGREFPALKRGWESRYAGLQEREQQIAATAESVPEELRAAQEKAWKDYAEERARLMEWARTQAHPSAEGFGLWVSDLWIWLLLFAVAFAAGGAWAGNMRARPAAEKPHPEIVDPPPQSPPTTQIPIPLAEPSRSEAAPVAVSLNLFREEEPFRPQAVEAEPHENGPEVQSPNALIMKGEPAAGDPSSAAEGDEVESPWGKMPGTTEFEKLERQRDEVLRCARKGMTPSEIARRLRLSQEQVDLIIRMRREKG